LCNYFLPLAAIADGAVPLTRAVTSSNRMTVRPQRQKRALSCVGWAGTPQKLVSFSAAFSYPSCAGAQ
jgi:hypothetical protein